METILHHLGDTQHLRNRSTPTDLVRYISLVLPHFNVDRKRGGAELFPFDKTSPAAPLANIEMKVREETLTCNMRLLKRC